MSWKTRFGRWLADNVERECPRYLVAAAISLRTDLMDNDIRTDAPSKSTHRCAGTTKTTGWITIHITI